jgi:hypothetical protein
MHRVEHSLHAELYGVLKDQLPLAGVEQLRSGERTQLVHKEWPETIAECIDGVQHKKGSFDRAILAPAQLNQASLGEFRAGLIAAPIVIEVRLGQRGLGRLRRPWRRPRLCAITAPGARR